MWNLKGKAIKRQVFETEMPRIRKKKKSKGKFEEQLFSLVGSRDTPKGEVQKCAREKLEGESGVM